MTVNKFDTNVTVRLQHNHKKQHELMLIFSCGHTESQIDGSYYEQLRENV